MERMVKMKISTRIRYGTRLMLDMAQHYEQGPIKLGDIANRQKISLKYLEQIIISLKKAKLIKSVRGPKGGHLLAKSPKEITVAEIVRLLEGGISIMRCIDYPQTCSRSDTCLTRQVWMEARQAMNDKLESLTLWSLVQRGIEDEKTRTAGKVC
jgi:Rrf2 family protein